ncbi:MAG: hypothetical protein M0Q94_15280 [Candidatus Cloacimonetes bacterium]|nr:hypothetical protein [Candidatus Cloacimonadota bacterium]
MSILQVCKQCNETKPLEMFIASKRNTNGKSYTCKTCFCINTKAYRKTIDGMIRNIYETQVAKSKKRGHSSPTYNLLEFTNWIKSHDNFIDLYNNWVNSNYDTKLRPSADRLENDKGYSIDNIRLVTWDENNHKEHTNKLLGINIKHNRAVIQYDMNMNFIQEHCSIRMASRKLNCLHSGIMRCCKGRQKYAYGFIWRYKESD